MKSVFLRMISAIVAGVTLLLTGLSGGEAYDVQEPERCLAHFAVLSDVHIEGNNFPRYRVFAKALRNVRQSRSGNDAVVFLGDNTMNGQHIENMLFHGTVRALLPGRTVLPVMGNHDIGNGKGDYDKLQKRWYAYTEAFFGRQLQTPYYDTVINGCHFIVLGMQAQEVYEMRMTDAQFRWLENVLHEAEDSGKPVFVFSHYPTGDATDADGNPTDRLTRMLAEYNREHDLFCFVGHTHMPMHLRWSFHTGDGFPQVYLPRLTELGGESGYDVLDDTGVGAQVEVYADRVLVRARDFYRGVWKTDQWEDGEPLCERTYALKQPIAA